MISNDFAGTELPHEVARSRILAGGGFLVIPDLLPPDALNDLEAEACSARSAGRRNVWALPGGMEERGGNPERAFTTSQGGAVQLGIFSAPAVVARLVEACGLVVSPSGGGSYSYYEHVGDFLGLHRDIIDCELSIICCVKSTVAGAGGGGLVVYPGYVNAPIADARAAGAAAATPAPIARGEAIALLGGFVPHEVTPMIAGQERVVSVMCYRVGGNWF
jgi:hypothetical protein